LVLNKSLGGGGGGETTRPGHFNVNVGVLSAGHRHDPGEVPLAAAEIPLKAGGAKTIEWRALTQKTGEGIADLFVVRAVRHLGKKSASRGLLEGKKRADPDSAGEQGKGKGKKKKNHRPNHLTTYKKKTTEGGGKEFPHWTRQE